MLCGRAKRGLPGSSQSPLLAQNDCPGSVAQFHPPSSNTDITAWEGFCLLSRFLTLWHRIWMAGGWGRTRNVWTRIREIVLKSFWRDNFKSSYGVWGKVDWRRKKKKRSSIIYLQRNPFCGIQGNTQLEMCWNYFWLLDWTSSVVIASPETGPPWMMA